MRGYLCINVTLCLFHVYFEYFYGRDLNLDIFSIDEQACGLRGDNVSTASSQTNLSDDTSNKNEVRQYAQLTDRLLEMLIYIYTIDIF